MNNDLTGGPVYPCEYFDREFFDKIRDEVGVNRARSIASINHTGMTLLDEFAGRILQGRISRSRSLLNSPEIMADDAYKLAEAMIKTRQKYLTKDTAK